MNSLPEQKEAKAKPTKEPKALTLAAKLCAITADVRTVVKAGRNQQQNYSYVKEADVSDAVGASMSKHGVFCLPTVQEITEREYQTRNGNTMNLARVKVQYTFINADNPEEKYEAVHFGDGSDSGDKALYKALTGCHKYALMRTFCIGSEDDPETGHEERFSQSAARQPMPIPASSAGAGEYAVKIPFAEKDKWKGALRAAGYLWHAESKTWRGSQPLPELAQYQVDIAPQRKTEDPPPYGDDDIPFGTDAQ